MNENIQSDEGVERHEERSSEKVVESPTADEGGPLGNVTNAVTGGEPTETVVERTEESVDEKPAESSDQS